MTILRFPNQSPGRFLSFGYVCPYYPFPIFDSGTDEPFGFVPALPGVIAFGATNGEATLIEACLTSMRARISDHWKGYEGARTVSATFLAFDLALAPMLREEELLQEHRKMFGRLPILNRA